MQTFEPPEQDDSIEPIDEEDVACLSTAGMTDQQKLQALLRFALAVWRTEATSQSPQNRERGTVFYINGNGELKNTPTVLRGDHQASLSFEGIPTLPNGSPDFSRVMAIAHTHPRYLEYNGNPNTDFYSPADPSRLLRPSPTYAMTDGSVINGDWTAYNSIRNEAIWQQENAGTSGPRSDLSLVIVGFDGTKMAINQYTNADNGYASTVTGAGGLGNDGQPGARGSRSISPLPPCND